MTRRTSRPIYFTAAIAAAALAFSACSATPPGGSGGSSSSAAGGASSSTAGGGSSSTAGGGSSSTAGGGSSSAAGGGSGSSAAPKSLVIGHSYQNLENQFFSDELAAEKNLAAASGAKIIDTQANNNPAKQLDDVNTLIARGVNVLAIDAVDPNAIIPALDAAKQAGIPVISLIAPPAGGTYQSLIYLDSVKDGSNACQLIVDRLGGHGKVVILTGPLQIAAAKERADGCRNTLKQNPGIQIEAEVNTDYSLRDAEQKMTDVLQAHPKVDAVFGGNDDIALGAARALTSAGQSPAKKVIVGVDGTEAALKAICAGEMTATLATFPKAEAQLVVDTAQKIAAGKQVTAKTLFPALKVDTGNLQDMAKEAGVTLSGCVNSSASSAAPTS